MESQEFNNEWNSACGSNIPSFRVETACIACSPYSVMGDVRQLRRMYRPEEGPYVHVTFYLHNMYYKAADWEAKFQNVAEGTNEVTLTYYLKEIDPPAGYDVLSDVYSVTVKGQRTVSATVSRMERLEKPNSFFAFSLVNST